MRVMLHYLKLNLKRQWAYKINFIGYVLLTGIFYLFQFLYIDKIASIGGGLGGYSYKQIYFIYFLFGFSFLLVETSIGSIYSFFRIVSEGKSEPYLIKPVAKLHLILVGWATPGNFIVATLFFCGVIAYTDIFQIEASAIAWIAFAICLGCLIFCNILFVLGLNLFTLITQRFLPTSYIHELIFNLSIIPTSLFKGNILRWIIMIIPVAVSSSLPAAVLFFERYDLLAFVLVSTLILAIIVSIGYRKAFRAFDGLGG